MAAADQVLGDGIGRAWLQAQPPEPTHNLCRAGSQPVTEQLFASYGLVCLEARDLRPLMVSGMRQAYYA